STASSTTRTPARDRNACRRRRMSASSSATSTVTPLASRLVAGGELDIRVTLLRPRVADRSPCGLAKGPMANIARLLAANEGYAAARANVHDARPYRKLAIVTCMD